MSKDTVNWHKPFRPPGGAVGLNRSGLTPLHPDKYASLVSIPFFGVRSVSLLFAQVLLALFALLQHYCLPHTGWMCWFLVVIKTNKYYVVKVIVCPFRHSLKKASSRVWIKAGISSIDISYLTLVISKTLSRQIHLTHSKPCLSLHIIMFRCRQSIPDLGSLNWFPPTPPLPITA